MIRAQIKGSAQTSLLVFRFMPTLVAASCHELSPADAGGEESASLFFAQAALRQLDFAADSRLAAQLGLEGL